MNIQLQQAKISLPKTKHLKTRQVHRSLNPSFSSHHSSQLFQLTENQAIISQTTNILHLIQSEIRDVLPFDTNSIFRKDVIYLDLSTLCISDMFISTETYMQVIICFNYRRKRTSVRRNSSCIHLSAEESLLGMIAWTVRAAVSLLFVFCGE